LNSFIFASLPLNFFISVDMEGTWWYWNSWNETPLGQM